MFYKIILTIFTTLSIAHASSDDRFFKDGDQKFEKGPFCGFALRTEGDWKLRKVCELSPIGNSQYELNTVHFMGVYSNTDGQSKISIVTQKEYDPRVLKDYFTQHPECGKAEYDYFGTRFTSEEGKRVCFLAAFVQANIIGSDTAIELTRLATQPISIMPIKVVPLSTPLDERY